MCCGRIRSMQNANCLNNWEKASHYRNRLLSDPGLSLANRSSSSNNNYNNNHNNNDDDDNDDDDNADNNNTKILYKTSFIKESREVKHSEGMRKHRRSFITFQLQVCLKEAIHLNQNQETEPGPGN